MKIFNSISKAVTEAGKFLVETGQVCNTGEWQSTKMEEPFIEAFGYVFKTPIPLKKKDLIKDAQPNMPWAEDHFQERISGIPYNPPPSHEWWPFSQESNKEHRNGELFSHTYPERFWPKNAGQEYRCLECPPGLRGIRFKYGDLSDVIDLLDKKLLTRQAYLPIFFPEDTGAVHGERVPCTLGYHFIQRRGYLHCTYFIRSCDYLRHFRDDIYMAARLTQHIAKKIKVEPGFLTMHIVNLHVWEKELPLLKKKLY